MTAISNMKSFTGVRLTRNCGVPSMKGVNVTRMEIVAEYATAKTTHEALPLGHKFGFASFIINRIRSVIQKNFDMEYDDFNFSTHLSPYLE